MIKKNDTFTVEIVDISEDGAGIGKKDGYIWFIKDTVIGDVVEAGAMKMKKTYGFARLIQVLQPSSARIEPRCPVARRCGGCQLQSMKYEEQLRWKQERIANALQRIGGLKNPNLEPIMGMEDPWRYRNKAQFPIGLDKNGEIIAGFYAEHSHAIIPQEDCLLGVEENQNILKIVCDFMKQQGIRPYNEEKHSGLVRHVLIRKGFRTGQLMVCLVINGRKLPAQEELVKALCAVQGMTSISLNINQEKTNVIMGHEVVHLYGPGYITDFIGDVKYQISPLSFYQVNPTQTEKLYGTALEYAGLSGNEIVWDLYCGIGTISLFLAQKAKKVYGVEIVPQAIQDAKINAKLNGMENTEFFVGKAEELLPEWFEKYQKKADVIVVDPPRKGCDEKCLETMVRMEPEKIVYVSCNPATLGRDVKYLTEHGYEFVKGRGCDMFGWSGHVETVVLLSKLKSTQHIC